MVVWWWFEQGGLDTYRDEDEENGADILLESEDVDVTVRLTRILQGKLFSACEVTPFLRFNNDVQVLASLPLDLQKDVIESAKRRQRMQSRQEYMPVGPSSSLHMTFPLYTTMRASRLTSTLRPQMH